MLQGEPFPLIIDETGDKKKGETTDYVARQYIGNLGKVENGIVSVNAYGVKGTIVFPLIFKVFKPLSTLKPEESYKTKPQLAVEIISELRDMGLKFELVLADSLYGESTTFIQGLNKFNLKYIVAIRTNHPAWFKQGQEVTYGDWQTFDRIFSNGKEQTRYICEVICQDSLNVRYWKITSDIFQERKNNTWYLMSNLLGELHQSVGNSYGFRNWIEYGIKQAKNELGWADFRGTDYQQIEKWWEVVCCAYLLVSLQAQNREVESRQSRSESKKPIENTHNEPQLRKEPEVYSQHSWWDFSGGWKSTLNNLRLIIQPYVFFNLIKPWLRIFQLPSLHKGFLQLLEIINQFPGYMAVDSG